MESYYAYIENGVVTSVEVVTDEFVAANPQRYSGTWKKVGTGTQKFVGKGYVHLPEKNKIIEPQPFKSWTLNETTLQWVAPVKMPLDGNYYWDEDMQKWILLNPKSIV